MVISTKRSLLIVGIEQLGTCREDRTLIWYRPRQIIILRYKKCRNEFIDITNKLTIPGSRLLQRRQSWFKFSGT